MLEFTLDEDPVGELICDERWGLWRRGCVQYHQTHHARIVLGTPLAPLEGEARLESISGYSHFRQTDETAAGATHFQRAHTAFKFPRLGQHNINPTLRRGCELTDFLIISRGCNFNTKVAFLKSSRKYFTLYSLKRNNYFFFYKTKYFSFLENFLKF